MTRDDLEFRLRQELHRIAVAVKPQRDGVAPPPRPVPSRPRPWRRLSVAAVASVAACAAGLGVIALRDGDRPSSVDVATQPASQGLGSTTTSPPTSAPPASVALSAGWRLMAASPLSARRGHVAVWTGSEMVVWGGRASGGPEKDGAAYNPTTDRWRSIATSPLDARHEHVAVWTGREMIMVGGRNQRSGALFSDGAAYDPTLDRWRRIASAPYQSETGGPPTAVWTGDEMILWGGDAGAAGAAYSPSADRWRSLPPSGLTPRVGHTAVWTGSAMVVWGGIPAAGTRVLEGQSETLRDGALYSPGDDRWRGMPASPVSRAYHAAAWTGREMVVFGGTSKDRASSMTFAAAYDVDAATWRSAPNGPLSPRSFLVAVWTGSKVIVWGGEGGATPGGLDDGASYSPAGGHWSPLPQAPLASRGEHTAVWTGTTLLIWGGEDEASGTARADGALLVPAE